MVLDRAMADPAAFARDVSCVNLFMAKKDALCFELHGMMKCHRFGA